MGYLDIAHSQIGTKSNPRKCNIYWKELRPAWQGLDWCFTFVSWCLWKAGSLNSIGGSPLYFCPTGVNMAKARGQWSRTGRAGALVFYDWGTGLAAHVELVVTYSGGSFTAIGGNDGNDAVSKGSRSMVGVLGFWLIDGVSGGGSGLMPPIPPGVFGGVSLTAEQIRNATVICQVGTDMGVSTRGLIVAIATAMQESTLKNLGYGDRDSLGLFQQRPSMGWGTPAQVQDPPYAARKFFEALLKVKGWESLPVTVAAQRVQISGFPDAYARWEAMATALVNAIVAGGLGGGGGLYGGTLLPVAEQTITVRRYAGPEVRFADVEVA